MSPLIFSFFSMGLSLVTLVVFLHRQHVNNQILFHLRTDLYRVQDDLAHEQKLRRERERMEDGTGYAVRSDGQRTHDLVHRTRSSDSTQTGQTDNLMAAAVTHSTLMADDEPVRRGVVGLDTSSSTSSSSSGGDSYSSSSSDSGSSF